MSGKLKSLNSVEFEEFFAPPLARPQIPAKFLPNSCRILVEFLSNSCRILIEFLSNFYYVLISEEHSIMRRPIVMRRPIAMRRPMRHIRMGCPGDRFSLSLFFPPYNQFNLLSETPARWFLDLFDELNRMVTST